MLIKIKQTTLKVSAQLVLMSGFLKKEINKMYKEEQIMAKSNTSTLSKLDELRNVLALLVVKQSKLTEICKGLQTHNLMYTPSQIYLYLEKHPITRFELEMAKELEGCLNDFKNLNDSYKEEKTKY